MKSPYVGLVVCQFVQEKPPVIDQLCHRVGKYSIGGDVEEGLNGRLAWRKVDTLEQPLSSDTAESSACETDGFEVRFGQLTKYF